MRGAAVLIACAAAIVLSACPRNLAADGGAAVRIEDLRAEFTPEDRGDFEVDFSVENPGFVSGTLTSIQWEVWLGNRWFAAGTQTLREGLPEEGRHAFSVKLPVVFRRTVPADLEPVTLDVGLRGGLVVTTPAGTQRLPFQAKKRVRAANAPNLGGEDAF